MAKPNNANYDFEKESEVLIVDHGETTTLSNSLFNRSHVHQCSVKISLAGKEMKIKAAHSGYKIVFHQGGGRSNPRVRHFCFGSTT